MEPGHIEFVHRSWPADPDQLAVIRRELANWLAPLRLTEEETADVVLAVDEAAANAVLHAYGPDESGAVELTLWTEQGPGEADATLASHCDRWAREHGVRVSRTTMGRLVAKLDVPLKKNGDCGGTG